jgi:hypothetical protein
MKDIFKDQGMSKNMPLNVITVLRMSGKNDKRRKETPHLL